MARHKMSLSVEYVSDWGVQEALRELFQNSIDHGDWEYKLFKSRIELRSKNTSLDNATLLLGHSRKSEGAIGKFGEGFKLACLVLTRLGKRVTIDTANEVWRPKLINSRTYKTQQLVFDTTSSLTKMSDLVFTIEDLTELELEELKHLNLHVNVTAAYFCSDKGIVIEDRPGDIFVNGLFVAHMEGYKFGYNFKPQHLSLDRDRRLVRDFDVQWLTTQIWKDHENFDLILDMIKKELPDVKYLDSFIYSSKQGLADEAAKAFVTEHGAEAIPVTSQSDLRQAQEAGHEAIILVPDIQRQLIHRSTFYVPPAPKIIKKTPREELLEFKLDWDMTPNMAESFDILIEKAERWYS